MAKLNARGRTELVRLSKVREDPTNDLTNWNRTTVALFSDRTILKKLDVRFTSDGRRHSYGWKKYGKMKEPGVGEHPEAPMQKFIEAFEKVGYTRE